MGGREPETEGRARARTGTGVAARGRFFAVAFGYVPGIAAVLYGLWATGGTRVTCTAGDGVVCTVESRAWLGFVVEGTREVRQPLRAVAETERTEVRERDADSGRSRNVTRTRHALYLVTRGGRDLLGRTYTAAGARRGADRLDAVLVRDAPGSASVTLLDLLALPAVLGGVVWAGLVAKLAGSNARLAARLRAREQGPR
jgi:hypothetical protein